MKNKQKGSSLLFTLIILVAMLFGTMALFKSTDMSTVVAGNLAFKEGSVNASDMAVKLAINQLQSITDFETNITTTTSTSGAYYSIQRKANRDGIVCNSIPITDTTTACDNSKMSWGTPIALNGNNNVKVYYIIDRLCKVNLNNSNVAENNCLVDTPYKIGCNIISYTDCPNPPLAVSYRVTVKIIGANNTESYVQVSMSLSQS